MSKYVNEKDRYNMKNVGIMSMQRIINYGSFLQAYGLKSILEELGCNVQFVDYHTEAPVICENVDNTNNIMRKLKKGIEVFKIKSSFKQKILFIKYKQSFSKKYMKILNIDEKMNYNPLLDVLIIGSDEVFNCIQKNSNVGYSLELFGKSNNANKLISYAASFGNTTLDKLKRYNKDSEIAEQLKKFDAISVRDENSGGIVKTLAGIDPVYNLDPVLVYDYINKCEHIPKMNIKEKYLIVYAYLGRITHYEAVYIEEYARKRKLKIYTIGGVQECGDKFIDCSPFEVLSYFKGAEEIITDTFHGSIFSIITKKKFVTIVRKSVADNYGNEEKISDLLGRLDLRDRMVTNIDDIGEIMNKTIDYDGVDKILEEQRKQAYKYLQEMLK